MATVREKERPAVAASVREIIVLGHLDGLSSGSGDAKQATEAVRGENDVTALAPASSPRVLRIADDLGRASLRAANLRRFQRIKPSQPNERFVVFDSDKSNTASVGRKRGSTVAPGQIEDCPCGLRDGGAQDCFRF